MYKTHKFLERGSEATPQKVKIRPIISGSGGPTDRPSWAVCTVLSQLLEFVPCHLKNVTQVLQDLGQLSGKKTSLNWAYESFDVESLYTNIDNQTALAAVVDLLRKNMASVNFFGMSGQDIRHLLEACLNFSLFQFDGKYYTQKRGLAMGSRLAPVLAVIYMSALETPSRSIPTLLFKRYIDDYLVVAESEENLDRIFRSLNTQSPHIRLTREKPNPLGGWLPFLNIELRIENGTVETRWYRKPANHNLMVHQKSHHPWKVKRNLVNTTVNTAIQCSTSSQKVYSKNLAEKVLSTNGYDMIYSPTHNSYQPSTCRRYARKGDNTITMSIPYLSDDFTRQVRLSLFHAAVQCTVIEKKGRSLKDLLVKNRLFDVRCTRRNCRVCPQLGEGRCNLKGAIYRLTCSCGSEYVGESGRPLAERINEHCRAAEKPMVPSYRTPTWSKHAVVAHNGEPLTLLLRILEVERNTWTRRILEGIYIKAINPTLNTKEELPDMIADLGTLN